MAPENSRLKFATDVARRLDYKMGGDNFNTLLSKQWSQSNQESKHCKYFFKWEEELYIGFFKAFEKYKVNFCIPWTNTFDTFSVLSALLQAGKLVVHTKKWVKL